MATYNDLSYGSSGEEVKKLQQSLINAGYDIGSSGVDGIYGDATLAAVKKYQGDNGLTVDGIAGNNTLGKLYGTATTATTQSNNNNATTSTTTNSQYTYDASGDAVYQQALQVLQQAQQNKPTYAGTYDTQLQDIYNQIVNRDKFKYDLNSDMLYQQYKDQYVNLGQMAMKDTMGQAAALTGGYGSSYGQSVGQQQYDAYLQQLNDVVPELYGMALDQYNAEGDRMLQQYSMVGDMRDDEYGMYQDALNQYYMDVDRAQNAADDAYNRGYENWYNSQQMGMQADQIAYDRQQDAYGNLVTLMTTTGYTPTADELKAAGMSEGEMNAYLAYYAKENPTAVASSGGNSGGGGGGGSYNNGGYSTSVVKQAQAFVGASADGKWGSNSAAAARAKGYNSLADVVKAMGGTPAKNNTPTGNNNTSSFTGSTYSEAAAYVKENGGSSSGLMTQAEWQRHKNGNNSAGGEHEASTYKEYLDAYVYGATKK